MASLKQYCKYCQDLQQRLLHALRWKRKHWKNASHILAVFLACYKCLYYNTPHGGDNNGRRNAFWTLNRQTNWCTFTYHFRIPSSAIKFGRTIHVIPVFHHLKIEILPQEVHIFFHLNRNLYLFLYLECLY